MIFAVLIGLISTTDKIFIISSHVDTIIVFNFIIYITVMMTVITITVRKKKMRHKHSIGFYTEKLRKVCFNDFDNFW